jgi:hypothetical protein
MNLRKQLLELYKSLGEFDAADRAPQQLIDVFNILLTQVKTMKGDHPVVASIATVPEHGMGQSINCGGLRALAQQLLTALRD